MAVVEAGATTYKEVVMTITISKLEPECLNYVWHIDAKYQPNQPEHLEQLSLMAQLVEQAKEQSESLVLHEYLKTSRDIRRKFAEEAAVKAVESPDAVH